MCTSKPGSGTTCWPTGFTAVELLVGLTLTVVLALAIGPLVATWEKTSVRDTDRTIALIQGRVAAARLERDLRLATAEGCPFNLEGPILEASPKRVVFLTRSTGSGLKVVAWEVAGSTLMRRWAPCPAARPASLLRSAFLDSKSMVERLEAETCFTYMVDGKREGGVVPPDDLHLVEMVRLVGGGSDEYGQWPQAVCLAARVGF